MVASIDFILLSMYSSFTRHTCARTPGKLFRNTDCPGTTQVYGIRISLIWALNLPFLTTSPSISHTYKSLRALAIADLFRTLPLRTPRAELSNFSKHTNYLESF